MAEMRVSVHRRPADVHADEAFAQRREFLFAASERVVNVKGHVNEIDDLL
jgi:hypothetical protein